MMKYWQMSLAQVIERFNKSVAHLNGQRVEDFSKLHDDIRDIIKKEFGAEGFGYCSWYIDLTHKGDSYVEENLLRVNLDFIDDHNDWHGNRRERTGVINSITVVVPVEHMDKVAKYPNIAWVQYKRMLSIAKKLQEIRDAREKLQIKFDKLVEDAVANTAAIVENEKNPAPLLSDEELYFAPPKKKQEGRDIFHIASVHFGSESNKIKS